MIQLGVRSRTRISDSNS